MESFLGPQMMNLLPIIGMMAIFYFMLYRPQKKEQEKRQEMLGSLHKGNKVLTIGGIYGEIVDIKDNDLSLKIADKVIVKVTRGAIHKNISQGKDAELAGSVQPTEVGEEA